MDVQENIAPEQSVQPSAPPAKGDGGAKYKLWEGLKERKLYTKSYDEFDKQFSTESAIGGLYQGMQKRKLYTKSKDEFATQFFSDRVEKAQDGKVKVKEPKGANMTMADMPKLANPELFNTNIAPIVDNVYNKNTANIINQEKLTALLPKAKEQKVKDLTIKTLLSQNKLAMEGSNSYKEVYDSIMRDIPDEQWMPSWTPTSARIGQSKEIEKQQNKVIEDFASSIGETPEEVKGKLQNGDYEFDYKKNKILTKGGFGDMAVYGLNNFADKWKLFVDATAAQERAQQRGNDNEIKYVINEYQKTKAKQREFTPYGKSDIEKSFNGGGQMVGEMVPYVLLAPAGGATGVAMGIQTAGSAIEEIINQPGTLDEKVARIKNQTTDQFMMGLAQDAAFKLIHVNDRNAAKELMAGYGPTKNLFNTFKEVLRVAPSDAVKAGLVGASQHVIDNLYKSNDGMKVQWDLPSALVGGATLDLMLKAGSVFTHGFSVLKNSLKFNIDKTNPNWFNRYSYDTQEVLNHIVSSPNNIYDKIIEMLDEHPSEDARHAKDKIEAFRNHYNSLPSSLDKATKFDALHLLQMKTEAMSEANSAADATLKKALINKASAIDDMLQMVLEGNKLDKKQQLLLPRFAEAYNREDDEAREYGFKDAKDFLEAYNRRQGTEYTAFKDIPAEGKNTFTSELVPIEQPKLDTTVPDWFFNQTETTNAYAVYGDVKKAFPELHDFLANADWMFNDKKENLNWRDSSTLTSNDVRNMILYVETSMPMSSKDFALQVKAAEQAETLLSYYQSEQRTMTKEDVKRILEKPGYRGENKFTPQEVEIMQDMVDRLKTDKLFNYWPHAGDEKKDNFYAFAGNILKSKKPDAFIHEIGHWGYFNMLTPEERVEFMRYASNRFGTSTKGRAEELVFGKPVQADDKSMRRVTNAMWDFQEYFADQFRQYYYNNVLPEPKLRNIFEKVKNYINNLIKLYKEKGYNRELTKYFDKIIDASKKMGEGETLAEQKARELSEQQKEANIQNADPDTLQKEFQKIKEKYDTRTAQGGVTEIATRPTGGVSSEPTGDTKPFRTNEPTDGQLSAIDDWKRGNYASEGELDADFGRRGLSRYGQTREEFIRSRFCK